MRGKSFFAGGVKAETTLERSINYHFKLCSAVSEQREEEALGSSALSELLVNSLL